MNTNTDNLILKAPYYNLSKEQIYKLISKVEKELNNLDINIISQHGLCYQIFIPNLGKAEFMKNKYGLINYADSKKSINTLYTIGLTILDETPDIVRIGIYDDKTKLKLDEYNIPMLSIGWVQNNTIFDKIKQVIADRNDEYKKLVNTEIQTIFNDFLKEE